MAGSWDAADLATSLAHHPDSGGRAFRPLQLRACAMFRYCPAHVRAAIFSVVLPVARVRESEAEPRGGTRVRVSGAAAAAALSVIAVAALLHRDVLFAGQVYHYRDIHLQWIVQAEAFVRCVKAGSWPVWNPYVSFGQAFLANPNAEVLYPLTWLNLVMMPWTYYTLFVVF